MIQLTSLGGPSSWPRLITVYSDFASELPGHAISLTVSCAYLTGSVDIPSNEGRRGEIGSLCGGGYAGNLPFESDGVAGELLIEVGYDDEAEE